MTTQKGDKIYVHVLKWDAPLLALPPIEKTIRSSREFVSGSPVEFKQDRDGIVLKIPNAKKDEVDRVVVFSVDR